jgi:CrcB protein
MELEALALVLVGGFCGGVARFYFSGVVGRTVGETYPWGTLVVNVTGALAIGACAGAARSIGGIYATEMFRDLVLVGLLGGYTTVSSFCLQTLNLAFDGEQRRAALYVVASAGLCVIAAAVGFLSIPRFFG